MSVDDPDTTPERIYELGLTAKGSALISGEQFLFAFQYLKARHAYPHTVEAYELVGQQERLCLEYSILGLDSNLENVQGRLQDKYFELARSKIVASRNCNYEVRYQIWLDEFEI